MKSDKDLTLETDRLEEVLDMGADSQPVVVVQYRNRGVPSWAFFTLLFMVPAIVIGIYHRLVVERYRNQAAEARQALEGLVAGERSADPLVKGGQPAAAAASNSDAAPRAPGEAANSESTVSSRSASTEAAGLEATTASDPGTAGLEAVAPSPFEGPPAVADKIAKPTMRSILPNPFAEGVKPPKPPTPKDGPEMTVDADKGKNAPAAGIGDKDNGLGQAGISRQGLPDTPGPSRNDRSESAVGPATTAMTAPDRGPHADELDRNRDLATRDGPAGPKPLEPLPSKEETLREFEHEAAQKQAEIVAQVENRQTEIRSQKVEEQIKFREELREVLRTQGNQAGPEIDNLVKRYGQDIDQLKHAYAYNAWRFSRKSQQEKVRFIRALELPETVILDFLSDDLHPQVRKRNGPRNESEVRARAATQLLKYPYPGAGATERPNDGAGPGAPPPRSQPVPRKDAVARPR